MTKPDLLVMSPIWPSAIDTLAAQFTLHRYDLAEDKLALLKAVGQNCRAVIINGNYQLGVAELAFLPRLEIVACTTAGFEKLDHDALQQRGIALTNASLALKDDVADTALMLVLASFKDLVRADAYVRQGQWQHQGPYPLLTALKGKRAGILGLGTIGREIASRLEAVRMTIGYCTRRPQDVEHTYFTDALSLADWCDVLIVAIPGGAETKGLIDQAILKKLGSQGTLINISRGSVVDEAALIACLKSGTLGAAGLDVYQNEPTPNPDLTDLPNVVLYPHHASGTVETRCAMTELAVENLAAHFAGTRPISPVNSSVQHSRAAQ
ncbi:2-hydroxyacid dehydrogenase [Pacificibacter sp.]|uniref:2-hydroxyacid dehydrogenase n=1 Tax=Pacificibacter sp. TaxID=1917866 RepID=UPI00321BC17F